MPAPTDALAALNGNALPDGASFLTLIAGQERRVLELKEELVRAEADLDKLKRHWARHEAQKKREDAKRVTKLQPLHTSLPAGEAEDDANGSSAWMQQEMERRKLLLSRSNNTGSRTIIPGQRHTRTLSLLSPAQDRTRGSAAPAAPRPPPPRKDSLTNPTRQSIDVGRSSERPPLLTRSSTTSDLTNEVNRIADPDINLTQAPNIDQEALVRTGKKIATDFKDGLWTFWEDLRQATVGDEHTSVVPRRKSSTQTLHTVKKQGSKNSLRPSSRSSSKVSNTSAETQRPSRAGKQSAASALPDLANPSFWTEHGVIPPNQAKTAPSKKATTSKHTKSPTTTKRLSIASNDAWDTWDDSPVQSRSSSSVASETTTLPSTVSGSPRMATNWEPIEPAKRDPIPWPAIKKSAGSLRRTASHLMQEWEKQLTPSPGEEFTGQDADYLGSAAEAAGTGAKKRTE